MSDFIAIHWEKRQLCGLEADVGKDRVRIKRCLQLAWPDDMDPSEQPEKAGEWLRTELRAAGVISKQALVTLPRDETVVRHLELPDAPDDELPDLVRFQAAAKSAVSIDRLCLDYLPLPRRDDGTGRDVLMASIPKDVSESLQSLFTAAGLELVSLSITPTATAETVAGVGAETASDKDEACLLIARHEQRVEISVLKNRHLLFSHSTQLMADTDDGQHTQAIMAQVSRSMVAVQNLLADLKIGSVCLVGVEEDYRGLAGALHERLGCEVKVVDPLSVPDVRLHAPDVPGERVRYAGPVGMLLAQTAPRVEKIDFLNPRRPVIQADRRKWYIAAAVAGVLLVGSTAFGMRHLQIKDLDQTLDTKDKDLEQLKEQLEIAKPNLAAASSVEEWVDTNIQWLDHANALAETMRGTERFYISSLSVHPGKGDNRGAMSASGVAKSRTDVETLNSELMKRDSYTVQPNPISRGSDDGDYPIAFQLDVDLKTPAPPSPTTEPKKSADAAPTSKASATSPRPAQPKNGGSQ